LVAINSKSKNWVEKTADKRPLIDLIHLWYHYHGQQLKTGPRELKHLITINADLGNLRVDQLTRQRFMQYQADKMTGGMKPSSINRNQTRLSSVFTALIKAEEFHIAKLCLSTGARWSEAAELKSSDLVHGRVTFGDAKNGKNSTYH